MRNTQASAGRERRGNRLWAGALALACSALACSVDDRQLRVAESLDGGLSTIDLIAGSLHGGAYVDGVGTAARFRGPTALASDGNGSVYVADTGNCTIRTVVTASGQVSTLAGAPGQCAHVDGTGATAGFVAPGALAFDGAGTLFVADGDTIRKVVIATGEVTTLAGSPDTSCVAGDGIGAAAGFCGLTGLVADASGNLYASDTTSNLIRKVVIATGEVSTLAGPGSTESLDGTGAGASFEGPGAMAIDGSGHLYVLDEAGFLIRRIDAATGAVMTLDFRLETGGPSPQFASPGGLAVDAAGNLYGAAGGTVFELATGAEDLIDLGGSSPGEQEELAALVPRGPAASRSSPPGLGLALDSTGNLYLADPNDDTIRRMVLATGATVTLAGHEPFGAADGAGTAAAFDEPRAVVADRAGHLYVADTDNDTIRLVVIDTGATISLAGSPAVSGAADGRGGEATFDHPSGLAIDGAGNLYIADTGNDTIRRMIISSAVVSTLAGSPSVSGSADGSGPAARFNGPTGLALDDSGNLFVADSSNRTIRRIVVATGAVTTIAGTTGLSGTADGQGGGATFQMPNGLALDGSGGLYVADSGSIRKISLTTGVVTTLAAGAGAFGEATGLTIDGEGYPLVADTPNKRIVRLDLARNAVVTLVGPPGANGDDVVGALPAGLSWPMGLALGSNGDLFVTSPTAVLFVH
jgi:sugar lactone lactonase YvrE